MIFSVCRNNSRMDLVLLLTAGVATASGCPHSNHNSQVDASSTQALMQSCGTTIRSAYNSDDLITNLNDLLSLADRATRERAQVQHQCRLIAPSNGHPPRCTQQGEDPSSSPTPTADAGLSPTTADAGSNPSDASASPDAGNRSPSRPVFSGPEPTLDDIITLVRLTTNWMCQASAPQLNTVFRYMSADYITHPEHRVHLDRLFRFMKARLQATLDAQERTQNPVVTTMDAVADVFLLAFVFDLQSGALRGVRSLPQWANREIVLSARTRQGLSRAERYGMVVDEMFRATRGRLSRGRLNQNLWLLGLSGSLAVASLTNTHNNYIDPQVVLELARSQSMRQLGRRASSLRASLEPLTARNALEGQTQLVQRMSENAVELDTIQTQATELATLAPVLQPELRIITQDIDLAFRALRRLRRELGDLPVESSPPQTLP